MSLVRATPFHIRTAELNRGNDWRARNGVTLPSVYDDIDAEALAARTAVVIADISWWSRVMISGNEARRLADRLFTNEASSLWPQHGARTLWLSDAGGVRGIGSIARYSADAFLLISQIPDLDWFARAAAQFEAQVGDYGENAGGLALIGPFAAALLKTIGFPVDIARGAFHRFDWKGVPVALSRHGAGYEIWVGADDALVVWDRIMAAGGAFGIRPAGLDALDILDVELGEPVLAPFARDAGSAAPSVSRLGLGPFVDEGHTAFNGRDAFRARGEDAKALAGLLLEDRTPAPGAPVLCNGRAVGKIFASAYSPALRRAIALAIVERGATEDLAVDGERAGITPLPFLPLG